MLAQRVYALFLLAMALVRSLFLRLVRRGDGVTLFRTNYDADGLPPVTDDERAAMAGFGRCIACGVCDRGESERIRASGGAYRGVMALVLAASRSMPDYRAAAYGFGFVPLEVLRDKERICPGRVPIARMAEFVRAKADEVGGALPLPPRIESLPPARLLASEERSETRG